MSDFQYTPQQKAVLNFTSCTGSSVGNGIVIAVAGSGKTFTITQSVAGMGGDVALCAFNSPIAAELDTKVKKITLPDGTRVTVGTVHSLGRRSLIKRFPKGRLPNKDAGEKEKIDVIMDQVTAPTGARGVPDELRRFVRKTYSLARQCGAGILPEFMFKNREAWLAMVDHFDLQDMFAEDGGYGERELPPDVDDLIARGCNWTVACIKHGIGMLEKSWDFEDMLYAVLYLNLRVWPFAWVMVDECQDLNPTRRALIRKFLAAGGRALFVGDPHQAIYGFTGADAHSFENIKKEFACTELPLTWSFRCARQPVRFVQQWVKHIESHPDAPEGQVVNINAIELQKPVMSGTNHFTGEKAELPTLSVEDAILCRNNAPLVELFFQMLRAGIPSHIEGKDLSKQLLKVINIFPRIKTLRTLEDKLITYKEKRAAELIKADKEEKAEELTDTVDAVLAVIAGLAPTNTVNDLKNRITSMFEDTKTGEKAKTLTLTSIHKSKGREWDRVFWYGKNRWNPSRAAKKDWQLEQENNLMYVAGTRCKTTLAVVEVPVPPMRRR
jgi:DNA helicase II / ATP-dependent DNA helicase PcrA